MVVAPIPKCVKADSSGLTGGTSKLRRVRLTLGQGVQLPSAVPKMKVSQACFAATPADPGRCEVGRNGAKPRSGVCSLCHFEEMSLHWRKVGTISPSLQRDVASGTADSCA